jgi:predicted nucleic acid-binding protein
LNKLIVADAGPLIAFARMDKIFILNKLFSTISITKTVVNECTKNLSLPGATTIQNHIKKNQIHVSADPAIKELATANEILGPGELTAIQYAYNQQCPLLIDEKLGREVAKKFTLKIIGTAGILLLAKKKNIISDVKTLIQQLKTCNYRLSQELISEILKQANES